MSNPTVDTGRFLRPSVLVVLGVALAACSLVNQPWRQADDYVAGLQCGMSEVQLRKYSERYPQLEIRNPDQPGLLIGWKENTQILLWLVGDGLTAYQVTWTYPLTHYDSHLKTDLCSGTRYVDLHLVGDSDLSSAVVSLNGERVGELSRSGKLSFDVPLGAHELRIKSPDHGSWSTDLSYDKSSSGHDRILVAATDLSRKP